MSFVKTDIHSQRKLSEYQIEIAMAAWREQGCFKFNTSGKDTTLSKKQLAETVSLTNEQLKEKFGQEAVWAITFKNYDVEVDIRKLQKFTKQIIEHIRDENYGDVVLYNVTRGEDGYSIICKPTPENLIADHSRRYKSAATNIHQAMKNEEHNPKVISTRTLPNVVKALMNKQDGDMVRRLQVLEKITKIVKDETLLLNAINPVGEDEAIEHIPQEARDVLKSIERLSVDTVTSARNLRNKALTAKAETLQIENEAQE